MATSAAERFEKIFANTPKPALPDPSQPHIADTELAKPELPKSQSPEPFKIPDVPQVKRKFLQENIRSARDIVSSSEDEDDYVNACKNNAKPEMLDPYKFPGERKPRQAAAVHLGDNQDRQLESCAPLTNSSHVATTMRYPEDFKAGYMKSKLSTHDIDGNKATGHFCIFSLVSKFPYKYMKDPSDKVSKRFFAANQFYTREWDVYCLQPPETTYGQPIILLPVKQVQQLLNEISSAFKIDVKLPPAPFTISFFDDKTPQPIFLGKTKSRDEHNEIINIIPPTPEGHGACPLMATGKEKRAFADFKGKCEAAHAANKKGKTNRQAKKAAQKLIEQCKGAAGLRRLQRFVGLSPTSPKYDPPDPSLTLNAQQQWKASQAEQIGKKGTWQRYLNVDERAQFSCYKNVVFVAFDVEANEHAHHLITEIGVSTLDIYDIRKIAPGPGGSEWIKQIRSRHFRIKEHAHMRNKTFVQGNPDGYRFGKSEFVALRDAAAEVDRCFMFPFSEGWQHDGMRYLTPQGQPDLRSPVDRNVVLVGHDIDQDIEYLNKLGSKIFRPESDVIPPTGKHKVWDAIVEALDVATLYKTLKKEDQPRSLGSVMADLGRDAWDLHNGGNDARYTMEALIALSVKSRHEDDAKQIKDAKEKRRIAMQAEELNKAWSARDVDPNDSNIPPGEVSDAEGEFFANTENVEEVEALNTKFLDPGRTPAIAATTPALGRHYGSDDELDEILDAEDEPAGNDDAGEGKGGGKEYDWFDTLVKATDQKLKLDDDDEESEFEM